VPILGAFASEEEIGDRTDAHEVDERHGAPQPLATFDLLRWTAVYVRERRRKQRELDDPRTTKGTFSLAVRLDHLLFGDIMIIFITLFSFA
jgi:hypothetical protein